MKKITICLFLLIPFFLIAQDEDYCPCQETKKEYEDIFSYVSMVNTENFIQVSEQTSNTFLPLVVEEESVLIVIPQKEEVPAEKTAPEEKTKDEEFEDEEPNIKDKIDRRTSRIKKSRKKFKSRIKRSRKAKKYRGKCPSF